MAPTPNVSTLVTWALYFIPIYIFVLDPLLRSIQPSIGGAPTSNSAQTTDDFDSWIAADSAPTLNLTDDSFISPEDGVPVNCAGEPAGYKVHLLSRAPLILYLENFLSEEEADHLVDSR